MFERKPPIRSTQEDVPELAGDIDRFVIGLAERIDAVQDAELAGQLEILMQLAGELATESDRVGYPDMAQRAREVAGARRRREARRTIQESVVELTDLAQRIRRGHRGAA